MCVYLAQNDKVPRAGCNEKMIRRLSYSHSLLLHYVKAASRASESAQAAQHVFVGQTEACSLDGNLVSNCLTAANLCGGFLS